MTIFPFALDLVLIDFDQFIRFFRQSLSLPDHVLDPPEWNNDAGFKIFESSLIALTNNLDCEALNNRSQQATIFGD